MEYACLKSDFVFSQAQKEHFPLLAVLYKNSFEDKAFMLPFEEGMINEKDSYCLFYMEEPIAMVTANPISYKGRKGHQIFKLCARKDFRGKGVAKMLLACFHEERRGLGDAFSLVMPGGEKLYGFYEKCGYRSVSVKRQYFHEGDPVSLPKERPVYTERYRDYCQKSAVYNGKTALDKDGLIYGLPAKGTILADDFLNESGICQRDFFVYLPSDEGTERCGMVCPFDEEVDLSGIFIPLANGIN